MRKSLTVVESKTADSPESGQDLLVFRSCGNNPSPQASIEVRLRIHVSLFLFGLLSSIACLWTMLYTSDSEQLAKNLGLHRVANSLENILSLLAYPILMFTGILTLYAGQQLYRMYKEASDPKIFRRHRSG